MTNGGHDSQVPRNPFEELVRVSRTARATRQRAAHLRAEAASLIQRSNESMLTARELAQTSNLLIAICLRTAFAAAWKARERPRHRAEQTGR